MPKRNSNHGRKVTEAQFWLFMKKGAGIYAKVARLIRNELGIGFTRQAVKARAEKNPQKLKDVREEVKDIAEEGLIDLMELKDDRIKLKAIEFYLKMQARDRGYTDKKEIDITSDGQQIQLPPMIIVKSPHEESD